MVKSSKLHKGNLYYWVDRKTTLIFTKRTSNQAWFYNLLTGRRVWFYEISIKDGYHYHLDEMKDDKKI